MTVSTLANKVVASGNGSLTVFSFSFIAGTAANLTVLYTDANGNQTTLTPAQYTVSLNAAVPNTIWGVGGSVTYPLTGSPIATGTTLTIERIVPLTQLTTINNQGDFNPTVIEEALDQIVFMVQQIANVQGLFLQANPADATAPAPLPPIAQRANKDAVFDAFGNLVAGSTIGNVTVSSVMIAVVTAATLALARTALGLGAAAVENLSGTGFSVIDDGSGNLTTPNIGANTILGNNTGGSARAVALTIAQVNAMLGASGTGTVTNVGLTMPAEFTVASSPVTTSGTIAVTKANQNANLVYAGPGTGAAAAPTFRAIVTNDLPGVSGISGSYGTSGSKTTLIESMTIDAKGRVTQVSYVTGASYGGGGGGGGTCFPLDEEVLMADGTRKLLRKVRIGEWTDDGFGGRNQVLALDRTTVGNRMMFEINEEHETSDEHPHGSPDREFVSINVNAIYAEWGKTHAVIARDGTIQQRMNVGLPEGAVKQMRVGQILHTSEGPTKLSSLEIAAAERWRPEDQLGNLVLGGSGTFMIGRPGNRLYLVTGWPDHTKFDYAAWKPKEQS